MYSGTGAVACTFMEENDAIAFGTGGLRLSNDQIDIPDDFYQQASEVLGEDFWQEIGDLLPVRGPRIDIYHTSSAVHVLAELPGLQSPDQVAIRLEGQTLVLEGEIPCVYPVTDNRIVLRERFFGAFKRALALPKPVKPAGIKAQYRQGLLTIELPLGSPAPPEHIPIQY